MLRCIALAGLAVIVVAAAGAATYADETPAPSTITFSMHSENGSKLEGIATIGNAGDRRHPAVTVMLLYENVMFIPELQYPTEIRAGKCGDVESQHAYSLNAVQSGRSSTTLKGVSLAKLLSHPYAVNVHAANAIERYVSCGEIARPALVVPAASPSPR
jgi:hypothetical protein